MLVFIQMHSLGYLKDKEINVRTIYVWNVLIYYFGDLWDTLYYIGCKTKNVFQDQIIIFFMWPSAFEIQNPRQNINKQCHRPH